MKATSEYLNKPIRTETQARAEAIDPMFCEMRNLHTRMEELVVLFSDYENGPTNLRYALHMAVCASDHYRIGMRHLKLNAEGFGHD